MSVDTPNAPIVVPPRSIVATRWFRFAEVRSNWTNRTRGSDDTTTHAPEHTVPPGRRDRCAHARRSRAVSPLAPVPSALLAFAPSNVDGAGDPFAALATNDRDRPSTDSTRLDRRWRSILPSMSQADVFGSGERHRRGGFVLLRPTVFPLTSRTGTRVPRNGSLRSVPNRLDVPISLSVPTCRRTEPASRLRTLSAGSDALERSVSNPGESSSDELAGARKGRTTDSMVRSGQ